MFHVEYTIDDTTTYWHAGGEALQARVGEVTEEGLFGKCMKGCFIDVLLFSVPGLGDAA